MNFPTFIVLVILAVIVAFIIRGQIRRIKNGQSLCGGNCTRCSGTCHCSPVSSDSAENRNKAAKETE